ncbi:MAG: histidine phosphatase family protein, partial [Erysipelotrichaceae bacterium]
YEELIFYPFDKVDGENFEMVYERIKETIRKIVDENKDLSGNIVCVSHGITILAAIKMVNIEAYEKQFKNKGFKNCSVTILTYENNKFEVKLVNSDKFVEKGRLNEENNK